MKKPRFTSINLKASRGFSLLEVMLAMLLLVLVAGSVYAVLRGAIDTAANIRERQDRRQQVEGILELCTRSFHLLPARAQMESRIGTQNGKSSPELIFRNAPQVLSLGFVDDLDTISVLGLKPQTGGRFSLALLRVNAGDDPLNDPIAKADPSDWLTLVPDVTKLTWRFFNISTQTWIDVLSPGQPRPGAVEMTLELADEPVPIRAVFQIIPLVTPPAISVNAPNADGTANPNPSQNPDPNQNPNGNPNPNPSGVPNPDPNAGRGNGPNPGRGQGRGQGGGRSFIQNPGQ